MLSNQPVRTYTKSQQTASERVKPSRSQRSNLSAKEDARLKQRSNGVCEGCDSQRATERSHIVRRWKSEDKPYAEEFLHLCALCHRWADSCKEGRQYLLDQRERLLSGEKPLKIREWRDTRGNRSSSGENDR